MKILYVWEVLAPISYVATVTLGGSLSQSYSYITQTGSEMIETGAPNKSLLDALFPVYDRLVGFFSSPLRTRNKTL
jgi:hypothetical protein